MHSHTEISSREHGAKAAKLHSLGQPGANKSVMPKTIQSGGEGKKNKQTAANLKHTEGFLTAFTAGWYKTSA